MNLKRSIDCRRRFQVKQYLIVLMTLHAAMLGYGGWVHGPGWDEVGHLPSGIDVWESGNTDLYRVNPPLVRMVATLPTLWMKVDLSPRVIAAHGDQRPEWDRGRELWQNEGRRAYWILTLCRWMCIPWSLLAIAFIFRWSNELYGPSAGLFSSTLWAFSPLVLTNSQMMTPDTGAAALGLVATYLFWCWIRFPTAVNAYRAGLTLGLAELTKFTWVVLFALAIWVSVFSTRRWSEWLVLLPAILVFVLVSSQTGFSHHLRYVLPCFPFVFVWMGKVWPWARRNRWRTRLVEMVFCTAIIASCWVFPHSHAYFNAVVGGPDRGHDHLLDSNIALGARHLAAGGLD